jgi:FdhD protein
VKTKQEALVLKVTGRQVEGMIDEVASELPVKIVVNDLQLVTLLCTPAELEELAVGFLLSEGLIRDRSSIRGLEVIEQSSAVRIELSDLPANWEKMFETSTISSGCGKGITFSSSGKDDRRIPVSGYITSSDNIRHVLDAFRNISTLYLETGGVHSAALSDGKEILFFSEDIGRHNAVDKLIGKAFLRSITLDDKILITSGRVTSEIMQKAGRNRFAILISRAAPSCMAISYAEDLGITLVGFARKDRMNIYSWPNRIKITG